MPAEPAELAVTTRCVPRRSGEELLSVSPEGHAWLAVGRDGSTLRVLDAFAGDVDELSAPIELVQISELVAWSGTDAVLLSNEGLVRLDQLERIVLEPPAGASSSGSLCGHPSYSGRLLSDGGLFERRDDGWWAWSPALPASQALQALVGVDGECVAGSDSSWLLAADGSLLRLEAAQFSVARRFSGLLAAAASGGSVAVLADGRFHVGPDRWRDWVFPSASPSALSAAEGHAWLASGAGLLRFDLRAETDGSLAAEQARWRALPFSDAGEVEALGAHASGVWTLHASQVCHHAVSPALRLSGLRPNERRVEAERPVQLRAAQPGASVELRVDGRLVPLSADADDPSTRLASVALSNIGWHALEVRVDGARARVFDVKLLPETRRSWASEVQPLYTASCASSTCHAAGNEFPVDLSTYEAWVAMSQLIRARVVQGRNMPPASHSAGWGEAQITLVSEWLEGGMDP